MNTNNAYSQILSVLENSELHSSQPEPLASEPLNSAVSPSATSASSTSAGSESAGSESAGLSSSPASTFGSNDEGAAGIDLFTLLEMASDLLGGNDKETKEKLALLSALTPFINPENTDKLEMAKKVIKISGLAKQFTKKN